MKSARTTGATKPAVTAGYENQAPEERPGLQVIECTRPPGTRWGFPVRPKNTSDCVPRSTDHLNRATCFSARGAVL